MSQNRSQNQGGSGLSGDGKSVEDVISSTIKRAFDEVASEPLPNEIQSLLEKLKTAGRS